MRQRWHAVTALMLTAVALSSPGGTGVAGQSENGTAAAVRVRAHMELLADDLLEGRAAGTRGYDVAAKYVATQLRTYGFEPAGDAGSFFQSVPLRESRQVDGRVTISRRKGAAVPLRIPSDVILFPDHARPTVDVTAPVVYAGFGITAPELKYDDYAAVDAHDKIALLLMNAPAAFPGEMRAHYAATEEKLENAVAHGAVGILMAALPSDSERVPWERNITAAANGSMTWIDADGRPADYLPQLRGAAALSPSGAQKLFADSPVPLDDVYSAAGKGSARGFDLPVTVTIRTTTKHRDTSSANVVARLSGRDAALAGSYVVLTAHLDHLGVGQPVKGDAIYNGAYDNAAGCAVLLEVARAIAQAPDRPLRSVLMAFVTAEEKGLVGSDYFARRPTVAKESIAANVNLDMPVLQWPLADVVAFGAENSSLGGVVERALSRTGLKMAADPMPEENIFVRSDQYSFVRQGVPAVYLMPAFTSKNPGINAAAMFAQFLTTHYHQPSDDLSLPIDLGAVAAFMQANYLVATEIANDRAAPTWNPGNFFGEKFGRKNE